MTIEQRLRAAFGDANVSVTGPERFVVHYLRNPFTVERDIAERLGMTRLKRAMRTHLESRKDPQ